MTGTLIVTGGSRGIGAASATLAAKRLGYAVAVNYRKEKEAADKVVAEIVKNGGKAVAIQGDTGVEADIVRLFQEAEQKLGPITGLVNNAGVLGPLGRIDQVPVKEMERLWAINITGCFVAAREAVKRMSTKHGGKGGVIVNITSAAVRLGGPGELVPYAASKGATHSFTIGLGKEVAQEGIRVNGVEPGLIDTEIQTPGRIEKFGPVVPIGRAGTADEVAEAVVWLLSPASSYCTASIITVSARMAAKKLGYAVAVNYRERKDAADRVVAAIVAAGGSAVAIQGDTGSEADVVRLFETAERQLGPVAGLVNNAGIGGDVCRVDEVTVANLERVWAVNITGYLVAAREAVKRLSTRHGGTGGGIVNITSAAVRLGRPGQRVHYAASKGAVHSFTIGLAKEVAQEGIRVNAVEPGLIATEIQLPGRLAELTPTVPIPRAGTTDEVAEAVVWLLSDAASYVTGSVVTVSGGR